MGTASASNAAIPKSTAGIGQTSCFSPVANCVYGESQRFRRISTHRAIFGVFLNVSRRLLPVFSVALLLGWCASLAAPAGADPAWVAPVPVSIDQNPHFANMPAQLQAVVNATGFHVTNRFCVVGYTTGDLEYPLAYIYWPTQNKIIAWQPDSNRQVLQSGEFSDLTRDILPDGAMTDNYLHRSDVTRIITDCQKRGSNYIIKKTAGGWVPISRYPQFATVEAQMQNLVDRDAQQRKNRFCVIGQKDGGFLGAYVYWPAKNRLIFWLPDPNDQYTFDALTYPVVSVDLASGLRNEEDENDEGDEMQRSYADSILKACPRFGKIFLVMKSR